MNPEKKPNDLSQTASATGAAVDLKTEEGGSITTTSLSDSTGVKAEEIKTQILAVLSELFSYMGKFFEDYKKPLTNVGLIVGALIAIYLVAAVVDAINDIPLLAPIFELIGIGYTIWFVKQYWSASAREELWKNVQVFLDQIGGKSEA